MCGMKFLPSSPLELARPVGKRLDLDISSKRDALRAGACHHHHAALRDAFGAGFAIEVAHLADARRVGSDGQLIHDAVRADGERLAALDGGQHLDVGGVVLGDDVAARHAVAAEVAGRAGLRGAAQRRLCGRG